MKKEKVYTLDYGEGTTLVFTNAFDLASNIEDDLNLSPVGDERCFKVKVTEMTPEEIENLPEAD